MNSFTVIPFHCNNVAFFLCTEVVRASALLFQIFITLQHATWNTVCSNSSYSQVSSFFELHHQPVGGKPIVHKDLIVTIQGKSFDKAKNNITTDANACLCWYSALADIDFKIV